MTDLSTKCRKSSFDVRRRLQGIQAVGDSSVSRCYPCRYFYRLKARDSGSE